MKHDSRITPRGPGSDASEDASVLGRLAALKAMSVKELKAEWQALFGTPAPNNSRAFLEMRIGYRVQELIYGGPDRDTRRMLDLLADEVEGHARRKSQIADPRNPVAGTKLVREWDGTEHTVTVLRDGFEWQGRRFRSLSAVEDAVVNEVRRVVQTPEVVAKVLAALQQDGPQVREAEAIAALKDFGTLWGQLFPAEQARIIQLLVRRVTVTADGLAVDVRAEGISSVIREMLAPAQIEAAG